MGKNIEEPGRPLTTIWRMRIACWITKATYMHSEYVIFIAFLLQQLLNKCASMLRYTYTACLVTAFVQLQCFFTRVLRTLVKNVTPNGQILIKFHFWDQC